MIDERILLGRPQPRRLRLLQRALAIAVLVLTVGGALISLVGNLTGRFMGASWGILALFVVGGGLLDFLLLRFVIQSAGYPALHGDVLSGFTLFDGAFHVDLASVESATVVIGDPRVAGGSAALRLTGVGPRKRRMARFFLETSGARVLGPADWLLIAGALSHNPDQAAVKEAIVWLRQEAADRS
jgi:hypothetical protein